MPVRPTSRPLARLALLIAILLGPLALARPALAQGTSGALPDPISSATLRDYADRLELSDDQLLAIGQFHTTYTADFKRLRESEIEHFLESQLQMQGTLPEREALEDYLRELESLMSRIAGLDRRLFDQMDTVLIDEQRLVLPRVRAHRERERYQTQIVQAAMFNGGGALADVSELYRDLDVSPETHALVDPDVAAYERRLTSGTKELYDEVTQFFLKIVDYLRERGFEQDAFQDPERVGAALEAMQEGWAEMSAEMQEVVDDVVELNRKTLRRLEPMLAPDAARDLRVAFIQKGYPAASLDHRTTTSALERALALEEIDDAQREALRALQAELDRTFVAVTEDLMDALEAQRKGSGPFDWQATWEKQQEIIGEHRERWTSETSSAVAAIESTLGPRLAERLRAAEAVEVATQDPASGPAADGTVATGDVDDEPVAVDSFVAARITRPTLRVYAELLALDEGERAVLDGLYEAYARTFDEVQEELREALQEAAGAGPDGETADLLERSRRQYAARRAARTAIEAADHQLFADVEAALSTPGRARMLERLRMHRSRARDQRAGWLAEWDWSGLAEHRQDLSALLIELDLVDAVRDTCADALYEYESRLTAELDRRYDEAMSIQEEAERMQARMREAESQTELAGEMQQFWMDAGTRVNAFNSRIVALNRDTLDAVAARLSPEDAARVEREYMRRSFPSLFNDGSDLADAIDRLLALDDLTDDQRATVVELVAEYRPAYDALTDEMASILSELGEKSLGFDTEGWKERQSYDQRVEQRRFERREITATFLRGVSAALTDEQLRRLGPPFETP